MAPTKHIYTELSKKHTIKVYEPTIKSNHTRNAKEIEEMMAPIRYTQEMMAPIRYIRTELSKTHDKSLQNDKKITPHK